MSGPLNRITAALYNTTEGFRNIDEASENAFNASGVQAMSQELYGYEQRIQQLESSLVDANNRLETMETHTKRNTIAANGLENAYKSVKAVIAGISVTKILDTSDELVQTTSRLNMMNDGLQTTDELVQIVYQSAQDSRGSFSGMADVVARFGNNAKDAFSSTAEVVQFANIVQKQMTIAGAGTQEAQNAMLQLSQAMGSGVLRGDELNSIFEQAPNLIQSIADYMDVPIGKIREMASDGKLSADVVKAAIFASVDDVNNKFNDMPKTWGQVWQSIKNTALIKFQPVLNKLNELVNSAKFQKLINGMMTAMTVVAEVVLFIFDAVGEIASYAYDNWDKLSGVLEIVLGILGAYAIAVGAAKAAEVIYNTVKAASTAASLVYAGATGANVTATTMLTAAQYGLNAAMYMCPYVWIIAIIIAVIMAVILLWEKCEGFREFVTDMNNRIYKLYGRMYNNCVVPVTNKIVSVMGNFLEYTGGFIKNIINYFADLALGVVDHMDVVVGAIRRVMEMYNSIASKIGMTTIDIDYALSKEGIEEMRNKALDSIDSTISKVQSFELEPLDLEEYYARIDEITEKQKNMTISGFINDWIDNMMGDLPGEDDDLLKEITDALDISDIPDYMGDIADSTDTIADSVDISQEDLKYLRDIAERDVINRFTTAEIKVDMQNNNNISSNMDLDGIIDQLTVGVQEAMEQAAEGVH